jgi:peptide/nickel transport system permease protein
MQRYILRRLLMAAVILWFISVAVFLLLRVSPGDPAIIQLGVNATPENVAALHREMGLDRPYLQQYVAWLGGFFTGDLGRSVVSQRDVWPEFRSRFPVSFQLMMMTVTWTVLLGIPAGIVSAQRRNTLPDYGVRLFAITALSVPAFWVATLVLLIPAQQWGYAPPLNRQISLLESSWDNLRQFGPASLVLALGPIAVMMRLTRSAMLEVLRSDYIRTARAKGLRGRTVVYRHALKNSLIPVMTVLGLQIAALLGGAVIIEQIFGLRGLGQYIFNAISRKDYLVAQTLVMYTAAVVVLLNLVVDLAYAGLDPRIRYQ